MSSRKRRYYKVKQEDKFETDAFEFLNEDTNLKTEKHSDDVESDVELAASDDDEALEDNNLIDDNNRLSGDDNSDDDDAPDAVDFATSRNTVLQQFRQAVEQIESEKQKKKDKRKKLDAQYKEQKAQKLKDLSKCKLPEDLLESLDSEIPKKKKKKQTVSKEKKKDKKKEDTMGNSEDELLLEEEERLSPELDSGSNFIPLTGKLDRASGVEVVKLGEEKKRVKSAAESAAEFLRNRLYGPHIPRETTKQQMAKEEKRKARFRCSDRNTLKNKKVCSAGQQRVFSEEQEVESHLQCN